MVGKLLRWKYGIAPMEKYSVKKQLYFWLGNNLILTENINDHTVNNELVLKQFRETKIRVNTVDAPQTV